MNGSLWCASAAIDLENALCSLVGAAGFPGWDRLATTAAIAAWTPASLLGAAAVPLYLIVCLLPAIQMLMRLVFIDVLLIAAPLGLLCWILPQTRRWSRWWSAAFVGTVITLFLQVTALALANNLFTAVGSGGGADSSLGVLVAGSRGSRPVTDGILATVVRFGSRMAVCSLGVQEHDQRDRPLLRLSARTLRYAAVHAGAAPGRHA